MHVVSCNHWRQSTYTKNSKDCQRIVSNDKPGRRVIPEKSGKMSTCQTFCRLYIITEGTAKCKTYLVSNNCVS